MKPDSGLFFLRVSAGLLMLGHGVGKVSKLFQGGGFPDPLGIGSTPSLALAALAEFVCAILVIVGWKTRLASLPIVATMLVAAFVFHWNDSWADKEFPLLYAVVFATLAMTGAGKHSLDAYLEKRRRWAR